MLTATSALLLALAAADRPIVNVDSSAISSPDLAADVRRLRGAVVARFLEEGYVVAPLPGDAHVRIAVRPSDSGWVVETTGEAQREYRIDPGPLPVVALEILHRAMIAIEASPAKRLDSPAIRRTVALSVSADVNASLARRLEEELALQLSDGGMFLVPRSLPHDRTVCLSLQPSVVTLGTQTSETCDVPTVEISRNNRSDDDVVAEVGHRAAKLVHSAEAELNDPGAMSAAPTPTSVDQAQRSAIAHRNPDTSPAPSPRAWTLRLGASGGALFRGGGTDPLTLIDVELFAPSRLGVRLQGGFGWSSGTPSLSVAESQVQIGPTWMVAIGRSGAFAVGLVGGILVHRYHFDAIDNGSRIDWNFSLPLALSYRLGSWPDFALTVLPGVAGPPRDHAIDGAPAWRRGIYYLGLTAGMGVSL